MARRWMVCLLIAAMAGAAGAAPIPFAAGAPIDAAATGANFAQAADIDGDGDLDVWVSAPGNTSLDWQENMAGDGSAWSGHNIVGAIDGHDFAVADVDGDGDSDVIAAGIDTNLSFEVIALIENTGGGLSWSTSPVDASATFTWKAESIAAADVDGDGNLDVVAGRSIADDVVWYRNDGLGGWTGNPVATSGLDGVRAVAVGDIDADGDVDVLSVSTGDDTVAWYANGGSGSFGPQQVISSTLEQAVDVLAADVDGDGDLDVVAASEIGGVAGAEVAWYENDGTPGGLGDWNAISVASLSSADGARISAADADADGDVDLVVSLPATDTVFVAENSAGDGSSWDTIPVTSAPDSPRAASAADLDSDGDLDVLSASSGGGGVAWYANETLHRSALYGAEQTIDQRGPETGNPRDLDAGDLDGDGDLDLVAVIADTSEILWYENDGSPGGLGDWASHVIDGALGSADRLDLGDLDGDGDLDVVAPSKSDGSIRWYENDGTPASGPWSAFVIDPARAGPVEVDVADIDGDGRLDVVATDGLSSEVLWYPNDGTPETGPWTAHVVNDAKSNAYGVRAADVDGDGDLDIVGGALSNTELDWYENDGTPGGLGDWTEHNIPVAGDTNTRFFDVADLDGDGDLDVVAPHRAPNGALLWHENAAGDGSTWTEHLMVVLGFPSLIEAAAADVDADGDLDVFVASDQQTDAELGWYENDGTPTEGAWTPLHVVSDTANGAIAVAPVDLDRDGDLDLAAVASHVNRILWHANRGGQFALPTGSVAYAGMVDGERRVVLGIDAAHRGRVGESDVRLTTLELQLTDEAATPLDDGQADALFAEIRVYADDGPVPFVLEPGLDSSLGVATAPFSLSAGVLDIALSGDAAKIAITAEKRLFVVPTLAASASSAGTTQFQIVHRTASSSTAEDDSGTPLSLEFEPDTPTGPVRALSTAGDFDGDGLANGDEVSIHGTDPGSADTDQDGLDDGLETAGPTDALDPDSDDDGLTDGGEAAIATDPLDPDHDDDGFCDGGLAVGGTCAAGDNCPADPNPGQENGDALVAGNACQCGDVSGDGVVTLTDALRVREHVVSTPSGPFDATRCNVIGPSDGGLTDCDVADAFVLRRFLAGRPVTVENTCAAYTGP